MGTTKIEWADRVWNPITGCSPVSEGCVNCYARRFAKRLAGRAGYARRYPFRLTYHQNKMMEPLRRKKPTRYFVCSMGDLFHPDLDAPAIAPFRREVWRVMERSTQHTFMLLTKRPEVMYRVLIFRGLSDNIWLGVSVENEARAVERICPLLEIPAKVRFVSVEPMLGPIDLTGWLGQTFGKVSAMSRGLQWVIAGPETGPGARPCDPDWIESLADQCETFGVPFFDKRKTGWIRREFPC